MLVTFQTPILDARSFFADRLGLIDGFDRHEVSAAGDGTHSGVFLRSIGMPKRRLLGPGDSNLNECVFFDLSKAFSFYFPKPNKPMRTLVNYKSSRVRYYLFNEVVGRIDVCVPVSTKKSRNKLSRLPKEIYRSAVNTHVSIDKGFMQARSSLGKFGDLATRVIQSRTTKEKFQKSKFAQLPSISASEHIVFIEADQSEIELDNTLQEISIKLDGVRLFHWYARSNVRSWIVLRSDKGRKSYQNARVLRMYLSRLYCHQAAFRTNWLNLPKLASEVGQLGLDSLDVDEYTNFLVENRRSLGRLSKGVSNTTGVELGPMARVAMDMISGIDTANILKDHERLISRKNIMNNLAEELLKETTAQSKIVESSKAKILNLNLNFLGRQKSKQTADVAGTSSSIGLAKPIVRKLALSKLVVSFADLFAIYGSQTSTARQDGIAKRIQDMQKICRIQDIPGPTLLNLVAELRKNVSELQHGSEQMCAKLDEIEQEILV